MSIFQTLSLAERARQLRNPEGPVGLAVAEGLNETNKQGNARLVKMLAIKTGYRVLEIGFGNGRTVPEVIAQAPGVYYAGIDISPTMVEEAGRFNAALVNAGQANFHLGNAEAMPFASNSFDCAFSVGVIHFWANPAVALAEVRRLLRPGGLMLMGCLAPAHPPEFAQPEHGFYLRDAAAWDELCRAARFSKVDAQLLEFEQPTPTGISVKRSLIQLMAWA